MTSPKTYATLRVSSDSQDLQKNRADIPDAKNGVPTEAGAARCARTSG
ncbi:MAG: hypothetical protein JNM70_18390 [Anaerolineae bacterium]|nr:hypothetical protein [Anaerolineae bacterium]